MCVHSHRGPRRPSVSANGAVFPAETLPAPPADRTALAGDLRDLIFRWVCSSCPCVVLRCAGLRMPVASVPEDVLLLPWSLFFLEGRVVHLLVVLISKSCLTLQPPGLYPARLPCPWGLPGENPGMGCPFLLHHTFNCTAQYPAVCPFFS